jgi:hypothetical protein
MPIGERSERGANELRVARGEAVATQCFVKRTQFKPEAMMPRFAQSGSIRVFVHSIR